ncbi:hypothetical protein ILYODFUR_014586 [Ilyodon furcidens]|uniref:Uncharacterized protein n=1 Tax=Ilyodon furcidens TaxID=33524 RepID=A0ABV0TVU6_9TELE
MLIIEEIPQFLYTASFSFSLFHSLPSLSFSYTHCTNAQALPENLNFRDRSVCNFFHSFPQTSWNLSFSLQWSNGDVCSSLVQLNFKKLYAHAWYHYCKHNYHKLFLQSEASPCLRVSLLAYSFADVDSASTNKGGGCK